MSFAQIYRAFEGFRLKNEDQWRMARLTAYQVYCGQAKNPKSIEGYMSIGKIETDWKPTDDYLDEYWKKYGTLTKRRRNVQ